MRLPSTLHLSLETNKPAFVLDLELLLRPEGLLLALHLARGAMVWCSRPIWAFLDDHQPGEGSGYPGLDTAIEIWNEARTGLNLGGVPNIYWPHDCDEESVLPKGLEGGFVDRLDALVAGLEWCRDTGHDAERAITFDPSSSEHETLALGAALWCCRATILAVDPGKAKAPVIKALEGAGIACKRLDERGPSQSLRAAIDPVLVETGVLDILLAKDLRLLALNLIMPKAPLVSGRSLTGHADPWTELTESSEPAADSTEASRLTALWNDSAAFWYRLP